MYPYLAEGAVQRSLASSDVAALGADFDATPQALRAAPPVSAPDAAAAQEPPAREPATAAPTLLPGGGDLRSALTPDGEARALRAADSPAAMALGGSVLVAGPGDQSATDSRAGRRGVVLVTPPQGPLGSPLLVGGPALAADAPALPAADVHALALRSLLDSWGSGTSALPGGLGLLADDLDLPALQSVLGDQATGQSPWAGGAAGHPSAQDVTLARPQAARAAVAGDAAGAGEASASGGLLGKVADLLTALGGGFFGAALLNVGTRSSRRGGPRPAMGQRPQDGDGE